MSAVDPAPTKPLSRWTVEQRRDRWRREYAVRWLHEQALIPVRTIQNSRLMRSNAYNDIMAAGGSHRWWVSSEDAKAEELHRSGRTFRSERDGRYATDLVMPEYRFPARWAVDWAVHNSAETMRAITDAWSLSKAMLGRTWTKMPARPSGPAVWSVAALDGMFPDLSGAVPLRVGRTGTVYGASLLTTRAPRPVQAGNRYRKRDLHMPEARWRRAWAYEWLRCNDPGGARVQWRTFFVEVPSHIGAEDVRRAIPQARRVW